MKSLFAVALLIFNLYTLHGELISFHFEGTITAEDGTSALHHPHFGSRSLLAIANGQVVPDWLPLRPDNKSLGPALDRRHWKWRNQLYYGQDTQRPALEVLQDSLSQSMIRE